MEVLRVADDSRFVSLLDEDNALLINADEKFQVDRDGNTSCGAVALPGGDVQTQINSKLTGTSNLSDLDDVEVARDNLSLGTAALRSENAFYRVFNLADYASINAAVAAAKAAGGGTVYIPPGVHTFAETLLLGAVDAGDQLPVRIVGVGGGLNGGGYCGSVLRYSGRDGSNAIEVKYGFQGELTNFLLAGGTVAEIGDGPGAGQTVGNGGGIVFPDYPFYSQRYVLRNLLIYGFDGIGINANELYDSTIENCVVTKCGVGYRGNTDNTTTLRNCQLIQNGIGAIDPQSSSDCAFEHNYGHGVKLTAIYKRSDFHNCHWEGNGAKDDQEYANIWGDREDQQSYVSFTGHTFLGGGPAAHANRMTHFGGAIASITINGQIMGSLYEATGDDAPESGYWESGNLAAGCVVTDNCPTAIARNWDWVNKSGMSFGGVFGTVLSDAATLDSPTFTGVPAAPTAAPGTNTTQIATTAFVTTALDGKVSTTVTVNGHSLSSNVTLDGDDIQVTGDVSINEALSDKDAAIAAKAPLDSPALTGTPTAPTATGGTNTAQIATTAFVVAFAGSTNITSVGNLTVGTWSATAIDATHGGTAQTSWATGDILYASASNTLAKLAGNTTITKRFLTQTGTGSVSAAPSWGFILSSDIVYDNPIAFGDISAAGGLLVGPFSFEDSNFLITTLNNDSEPDGRFSVSDDGSVNCQTLSLATLYTGTLNVSGTQIVPILSDIIEAKAGTGGNDAEISDAYQTSTGAAITFGGTSPTQPQIVLPANGTYHIRFAIQCYASGFDVTNTYFKIRQTSGTPTDITSEKPLLWFGGTWLQDGRVQSTVIVAAKVTGSSGTIYKPFARVPSEQDTSFVIHVQGVLCEYFRVGA